MMENYFTKLEVFCLKRNWFAHKMAQIRDFMNTAKRWIAAMHKYALPKCNVLHEEYDEVVHPQVTGKPDDSVS